MTVTAMRSMRASGYRSLPNISGSVGIRKTDVFTRAIAQKLPLGKFDRMVRESMTAHIRITIDDAGALGEIREKVVRDVLEERYRQIAQWSITHDDNEHTMSSWIALLKKFTPNSFDGKFRERMIQTAALAIAAVESLDRKSAGVHLADGRYVINPDELSPDKLYELWLGNSKHTLRLNEDGTIEISLSGRD
jgi:transposase-like protein